MIQITKNNKERFHFKLMPIGLLALTGVIFIVLITAYYSVGITPDSVAYISVARNLVEGNGFVAFNGVQFIYQPPLYPILLSVIKWTLLVDPQISAGYVNSVLFGLIILFSGYFLLKTLKSYSLVLLGTIAVMASFALVQASLMALSETLFIFTVLMFLIFVRQYQKRKDVISLVLFSVSAAMACLTRYTGVVLVLAGIMCIILWGRQKTSDKFWHSTIFAVISCFPISLWIIRNFILSGSIVGQRASSSYTLAENLKFFYETILSWYFPLNSGIILLIIIALIAVIGIFIKLKLIKSIKINKLNLIYPSLIFVFLYSGIIIISSTTTAYDQISDRLLSPIYIPITIIVFFYLDQMLLLSSAYINPKIGLVLISISFFLLIKSPAQNSINFIHDFIEMSGWGYSCYIWRGSETIEYLTKHNQLGKNYQLFSNEPEAVYILTNLKTKRSPSKTYYNSPQAFTMYPNPNDMWLIARDVCLVWFSGNDRSFLFSVDELKRKMNLTEIAHLKDGKIYTFSAE